LDKKTLIITARTIGPVKLIERLPDTAAQAILRVNELLGSSSLDPPLSDGIIAAIAQYEIRRSKVDLKKEKVTSDVKIVSRILPFGKYINWPAADADVTRLFSNPTLENFQGPLTGLDDPVPKDRIPDDDKLLLALSGCDYVNDKF